MLMRKTKPDIASRIIFINKENRSQFSYFLDKTSIKLSVLYKVVSDFVSKDSVAAVSFKVLENQLVFPPDGIYVSDRRIHVQTLLYRGFVVISEKI